MHFNLFLVAPMIFTAFIAAALIGFMGRRRHFGIFAPVVLSASVIPIINTMPFPMKPGFRLSGEQGAWTLLGLACAGIFSLAPSIIDYLLKIWVNRLQNN
jgi:hypothetical protein